MKVGIFDSGLGGLTVLKALVEVAEGVEFFYLGDTARVPYGIRSEETVKRYSLECSLFLKEFDIDLLVIACNTASAKAGDFLRKRFPSLDIYDVIEPAVETVAKLKTTKVGVIGTPSTVGSNVYKKKLLRKKPHIKVFQKATPLLVPLVEEGLLSGPVVDAVLNHYLSEWKNQIDTLLLGCTHYPLLEERIKELFPNWSVVNSARPLARKLAPHLKKKGSNKIHLFFTDKTAFLKNMLKATFNKVESFEIVSLKPTEEVKF